MGTIRDKIATISRLRFWRLGLRFPMDCRIRVWGTVLDRHEDYGITAWPVRCERCEDWWQGYYRYDAKKGRLILTGAGLGVPLDKPPHILPLRHVLEDGLTGFGPFEKGDDAERSVVQCLLEVENCQHFLALHDTSRERAMRVAHELVQLVTGDSDVK